MINKFSAFCSKASVLKKKIRQNGVKQFLALCQNAIFGNMSVHLTKYTAISLIISLFFFGFQCFHWFQRKKIVFTQKSLFYSKSRKFYSIQNTAQKYFLFNLLFLPLLKISCFITLSFLLFSKNGIFLN